MSQNSNSKTQTEPNQMTTKQKLCTLVEDEYVQHQTVARQTRQTEDVVHDAVHDELESDDGFDVHCGAVDGDGQNTHNSHTVHFSVLHNCFRHQTDQNCGHKTTAATQPLKHLDTPGNTLECHTHTRTQTRTN